MSARQTPVAIQDLKMKRLLLSLFLCLVMFWSCAKQPVYQKIAVAEYQDKVYASWLGQCIGNIYGLPHENAYINEPGPENFPYGYTENSKPLKELNGAFSDDDTDIEYMYLLAMEKYGPEPTYQQLTESWKYHVRDRVWLANRAAVAAMNFGYTPPVTGLKQYNPHWFQIDPQLVNEIWAVASPGMVGYAADKSGWAARITNDSWGIEPTVHYGAMYAAAFFETDIEKLIDAGSAALPQGSRFAGVVDEMKALYEKYPNNWQQARKEMAQKYYYNDPAETRTIWNAILNGACGILALLYGQGDFQKTLDYACAMGFDADNQAATMSGLLGVICGSKGLPHDLLFPFPELNWQYPFNDQYINVSRYDMPNGSLRDMAAKTALMGEKIILAQGGKKITENGIEYYLINTQARFTAPLEFPVAPMPVLETGVPVNYHFMLSGGSGPFSWQVVSGQIPPGLVLTDGHLTGTPGSSGIYDFTLQVTDGQQMLTNDFRLVVRGKNLAAAAIQIIANVQNTNLQVRDSMWLTVGPSLYASDIAVIRDGKLYGDNSAFYSITALNTSQVDFYGYEWAEPQQIGLVDFFTGSMEEFGGWFASLDVEYKDDSGRWIPVHDLIISPALVTGSEPYNKPHFVEYLLAFKLVTTTAIRIIGNAGSAPHWSGKQAAFTSITELAVYPGLPEFEKLAVEK